MFGHAEQWLGGRYQSSLDLETVPQIDYARYLAGIFQRFPDLVAIRQHPDQSSNPIPNLDGYPAGIDPGVQEEGLFDIRLDPGVGAVSTLESPVIGS